MAIEFTPEELKLKCARDAANKAFAASLDACDEAHKVLAEAFAVMTAAGEAYEPVRQRIWDAEKPKPSGLASEPCQ
jgi:hypothetical protein